MSNRIAELEAECWDYKSGVVDTLKFAKLIVQECMNVLDPGEHQLIARFQARQMLAEHFGVE